MLILSFLVGILTTVVIIESYIIYRAYKSFVAAIVDHKKTVEKLKNLEKNQADLNTKIEMQKLRK